MLQTELRIVPKTALEPMPERPTLLDFFRLRFSRRRPELPFAPAPHMAHSALRALRSGAPEETVLACLLHDVGLALISPDHGWWGAQLVAPYVSERVAWAIQHHQALRFFPDPAVGYEYPASYRKIFGEDYLPEPYLVAAYEQARAHRWYMDARLVTLNDEYAFDPQAEISLEPLAEIVGRHFHGPTEGLGFDGSAVAHMWRSIMWPGRPL
jgi:hypothetical protein